MKKLLHWGPSFDALSIDEKDKEEEKLPYVSRYFDSYLVQLGSFGCLGLIGLARATVTSDLPRGNVCTIYNVCSHKWLCPNLPSLLSSRWFLRSCPAAKRGCGFGVFFFLDLPVFLLNGFIPAKLEPYSCSTYNLEEGTIGQQLCLKKNLAAN